MDEVRNLQLVVDWEIVWSDGNYVCVAIYYADESCLFLAQKDCKEVVLEN